MSGQKESHKPEKFYTQPVKALGELARVYGYGAEKYAPYNYLEGYKYSLSIDAAMRHFYAFLDETEDDIDESGFHHLAHAAWHMLNLLNMELQPERYGMFDDRQGPARENFPEYYDTSAGFHKKNDDG